MNSLPKKYISELDGLRAISVWFVLMVHGSYGGISGGFLGVDVFFVISGYIITRLLQSEYEKTARIDFKKFYMRRVIRIIPPLILCVVLGVLYMLVVQERAILEISTVAAASLFFVGNLLPSEFMGPLAHTWSLAIEEQFYIFWPALFLLIWSRNRRVLFIVLFAIVICTISVRHFILLSDINNSTIYSFTFTRIDGLAIGALLAVSEKALTRHLGKNLETFSSVVLYLTSFILAVCLFTATATYMRIDLFAFTAIAIVSALLIYSAIYAPQKHFIKRFLNMDIMRYFGRRSYGLYLYHYPIFMALEVFRVPGDNENFVLVLILKIILSIAVTELSWRLLENPLISLKTKLYTVKA